MNRKQTCRLLLGVMVFALVLSVVILLLPVSPLAKVSLPAQTPGRVAPQATSVAVSAQGGAPVSIPGASEGVDLPAAPILTRPTDHSVNVNVVMTEDLSLAAEYWEANGSSLLRTPVVEARAGVPVDIVISSLMPDTAYGYRLCTCDAGRTAPSCSPGYSFHTQRSPGSAFIFDVQADSHLDGRASGDLYLQALENELADQPDFLIDLGDTFMTEKEPVKNNQAFLARYVLQRSYFDDIGHSVPLFLVLGNHDGESGYNPGSIATASLSLRKTYFPNPEPDGFYTGNPDAGDPGGPRDDYYAWEWGDALFVVIDPYWYTMVKPGEKTDGWGWTLGETQYRWLGETLEASTAKYRFVFAHHLVGGDAQGRGGTEYASLYEWGGRNQDGSWGFEAHRPGWGRPIHQLLVENNVTAFFHGHDHFFALQKLDGVIYQEVPQPATTGSGKADPGAEYGYTNGVRLASPGHLRVTVSPGSVLVEYIRSSLSGGPGAAKNGAVVYSYLPGAADLHRSGQEG